MASAGFRVAVLGATGAVGAEILQVLDERRFPVRELIACASADSEGDEIEFRDGSVKVSRARGDQLADCDLVLCAAPGLLSGLLPAIRKGRARVIDVTGALELDPEVPLWLPGLSALPAGPTRPRLVAVPRGVTTGIALALAPFSAAGLLRRVTAVTLESASGAGIAGVGELTDHTVQVLNRMSGERSESEIFSQSLAFDCLPQIGNIEADGETTDEQRLRAVLRRLLRSSELPIELTRVRIPTLGGSLAAVHAELARPVTLDEATGLWAEQKGIGMLGDEELPTPRGSLGHDDAAVGRVRAAGERLAFVVALNDLRLGAALGVVGAAEALTT
ncbi:MAG: Asd/ArgC dimerization domain-containing protein [Myxococcota bacterium]